MKINIKFFQGFIFFILIIGLNSIPQKWNGNQDNTMTNQSGIQYMQFSNVSADAVVDEGRIVFPDEIDDRIIKNPVPVCKDSTYCERTPYYPEQSIKSAFQKKKELKYLAENDVLEEPEILQRFSNDSPEDVPLCQSMQMLIVPKTAENKKGAWRYIANFNEFKQGVVIEKCRKAGETCDLIEGFAAGYTTVCKQKFIIRKLAYFNTEKKDIQYDEFPFPSSCCCHVKLVGNPLYRLGSSVNKLKSKNPQHL